MDAKVDKRFSKAESISLATLVYYLAFGLYIFVYGLSRTYFVDFLFVSADTIVDAGRIICVLLLAGKLFTQHYTRKQLLGIAIAGVIAVASLYVTRDWNLVLLYFFIVAGQGISIKKLAAIALPIQLAMLLLTVAFANAGIIESRYLYRNVDGVLQLRSSLGYVHPNSFGQSILSVCVSYAIMRFPKFNPLDLLLYVIGLVVCYLFAGSRTSMACIAFVILCVLVARLFHERKPFGGLSRGAAVLAFGTAAFSFFMMLFYDSGVQWMQNLNSLLSSRFSLAHAYWVDYPIRPLGYESRTVTMYINASYTQYGPDNAYVRMLLLDGLLPALTFFALYLLTFARFARRRHFDACIFGMLVFAVAAVMESYSLSFAANYCLVGTTALIYGWEQYVEANAQAGNADDSGRTERVATHDSDGVALGVIETSDHVSLRRQIV